MFASRLRRGSARNRLSVALDQRRAAGSPIVDLTESNPTRAGFDYPPALLEPLARPAALQYAPNALGVPAARTAICADFDRRGVTVAPERIVLTASTSEAYSVLFKLLCDPGDAVLVPRPSYPLVEHLTDLDGVAVEPYALEFHGRWSIDLDGIRRTLAGSSRKIRAIVLISPNNPTGSIVTSSELVELTALAARHDLALIADEVFSDYPIQNSQVNSALAQGDALTFGLGGLSKSVGLPQVKLGWIGVSGPQPLVEASLERLETICDTYLSVSTPVQLAAADLLRAGASVRAQIHARVRANAAVLQATAARHPECTVFPIEAGWYAVVQIPAVKAEEAFVVDLLERTGVLVHPGYFFDFEREAFLVLSLLPASDVFASALSVLFAEIGAAS
jgi:aspartate/methionine/tyrosine aminotransferase